MPDEQLQGDKKSDWYNSSIDVFSTGVTLTEYLQNLFETDINFDFNVFYILEAMLEYNPCEEDTNNYVHC